MQARPYLDLTDPDQPTLFDKIKSAAGNVLQGILFIDGLCVITLYYTPSQICAQAQSCGKLVSDLIGYRPAVVLYAMGGLDYAALNGYFALKSMRSLSESLSKQKTMTEKIGKGAVIFVYAATQEIQTLFATLGTRIEQILTLAGGAPGAIYSATGMMDEDIPYLVSTCKSNFKELNWYLRELYSPLSEMEKLEREKFQFYRKQHKKLIEELEAKWNYIRTHAGEINVQELNDQIAFLMRQPGMRETTLEKVVHQFGEALGVFFGLNISVGFALNSFRFIKQYIPNLFLQILTAAYMNSASIYSNLKVTTAGVGGIFDVILDIIRGKNIRSATYQMHPYRTALVLTASLLLSSLSYAVANTIYEQELPYPTNIIRNLFRITGNVGMDFYHFAGLMELSILLFNMFSSHPKEKSIYGQEEWIQGIKKMSGDEYPKFVENNTHALNDLLGIETYEQAMEKLEIIIDAEPVRHEVIIEVKNEPEVERKSFFQSCMSWFYRKTPDIEVAQEPDIENGLRAV